QLERPRRRLAEPERDRRRRLSRVLDAHASRLDAADTPRVVAEEEDVARHALDGEVLVHLADVRARRLLDDLVIGGVGNRAAARGRGTARAAPAADAAVDAVVVQVRRAPPAAG